MSVFFLMCSLLFIPTGIIHILTKDGFYGEDMYFSVKDEHRFGWMVTIVGLIFLILAFVLNDWH